MATQNAVVRARIDGRIKAEAEAVLASIGLTVSDAFRMMMMRIAIDKVLPFEPLIPSDETIAAMKATRRSERVQARPPDNLLEKLKAVENAIAQQKLEGLEVPPDIIEQMNRAARGEIEIEEGISNTITKFTNGKIRRTRPLP